MEASTRKMKRRKELRFCSRCKKNKLNSYNLGDLCEACEKEREDAMRLLTYYEMLGAARIKKNRSRNKQLAVEAE